MLKKLKYLYNLFSEEQIIVYQMGKVGSSSIYNSLKNNGFNVIHVHNFGDHDVFNFYKNTDGFHCFYPIGKRIRNFISSKVKLTLLKKNNKVKIITCVRDLEKVIISRYMQDLHLRLVSYHHKQIIYKDMGSLTDEVINNIESDIDLDYFLNWFDVELKNNFGVDVYDVEYDISAGVGVTFMTKKPLLVLNMSKVNEDVISSSLSNFIDSNCQIKITSSNVSSNKWYSEIQRIVRNNYCMSKSYKQRIEKSRLYNFFDL
jgi:hypothetical protein